jgi:hypothetical protein
MDAIARAEESIGQCGYLAFPLVERSREQLARASRHTEGLTFRRNDRLQLAEREENRARARDRLQEKR